MLKFIPGILLLQVITIALVLIAPADLENWGWLRLAIPVLIARFLTAFWFGSIAAHQRKDEINRLKVYHAKERENIRVKTERAKTKLVKQSQRKTLREARRSSLRANFKIGLGLSNPDPVHVLGGSDADRRRWRVGRLSLAYPARERQTTSAPQRSRYITYHQRDAQ
jgi:hypothetical protein